MTAPTPGWKAAADQKLTRMQGELLGIASRYTTGELVIDAADMSRTLKDLPTTRETLAEGVAVLALTMLRDRQDLFVWAPDRVPALPHPDGPPGQTWDGSVADIAARLVAGVASVGPGTVRESTASQSLVYHRALGAITALADQTGADPEEQLRLIRDVLHAVDRVEQEATLDR